jgi:hypothetical protein
MSDDLVFREGDCQHFVRDPDEPASRLVYRGDLMEVRR